MKFRHVLGLAVIAFSAMTASADVAISIRYFKEEGTSHYHLYLYSDDGKVIRQLTSPEDAQDTMPVFSKDGLEIVFIREERHKGQVCSIRTDGTYLRVLEKTPRWYPAVATPKDCFAETVENMDALWSSRGEDLFVKTPDEKQELVLASKHNAKIQEQSYNGVAFTGLTVRDGENLDEKWVHTGDMGYTTFCPRQKSPFLLQGAFRVAFFCEQQGSTDGMHLGVLDLTAKTAKFISENPAFAIAHGTRPGFFCVCEERYLPLGKTGHTVNCLYLDWWDEQLHQTRFANAISLFGGASVRVKGQPQLNISPQSGDDRRN